MPGMQSKPLLFWLVLPFLGSCLGILGTLIAARKTRSGENIQDILTMTGEFYRGQIKQTATIISTSQMIKFALTFALGGIIGFLYRDHQLNSNTRTLVNVEVLEAYPAGNYRMATETGTQFPFNPCPESLNTKFEAGSRLKMVTYEQHSGCKFVKYYLPEVRSDGKVRIGEISHVR